MRTTEVAPELGPPTTDSRRVAPFDRWTIVLALALSLGTLGLYLLTLSRHYSPDSMSFALLVDRGELSVPLFFLAEHLLWPFAGWVWYHLWLGLGYGQGPLVPMQVLNAVAGAAGVGLFFLSLRAILGRSRRSAVISIFSALLLAFSYGYWFHGTDAEDQIIANALTLAAFLLLVARTGVTDGGIASLTNMRPARIGLWRTGTAARIRSLLLPGLFMSVAIMAHGTAVLFLPALALGLWLKERRLSPAVGLLVGVVAFVGLAVVVGALVHGFRTPGEYVSWLLSAPSHGVWGRLSPRSLWVGAQGMANAVAFLQGGPAFKALLRGTFEWHNFLSVFLFVGITLLSVAVVVYLARIGRSSRVRTERRQVALVCLVWIVVVGLFDLYWAPEDSQFWVGLVPPLIVGLAMAHQDLAQALKSGERLLDGAFVFGVGALFVVNSVTAFFPRSDTAANEGLAKALCLGRSSSAGDLFITPGWDWASGYGPYFAKRQVFSIVDAYLLEAGGNQSALFRLVDERIAATLARGGRVYVVRLFSLDANDGAWLKRTTGLVSDDFSFKRKQAWTCGGEAVWELEKQ